MGQLLDNLQRLAFNQFAHALQIGWRIDSGAWGIVRNVHRNPVPVPHGAQLL